MAIFIQLQDFQPKNPAKEYVRLHADPKTVSLGRQVLESSDPNRHDAFIRSASQLGMSLEEHADSITGRAGSMAVGEMARMAEFKFAASEKLFALRTAVANMRCAFISSGRQVIGLMSKKKCLRPLRHSIIISIRTTGLPDARFGLGVSLKKIPRVSISAKVLGSYLRTWR